MAVALAVMTCSGLGFRLGLSLDLVLSLGHLHKPQNLLVLN